MGRRKRGERVGGRAGEVVFVRKAEEEAGVTEEVGVPEVGTVAEQANPQSETIVQMTKMHEMVSHALRL